MWALGRLPARVADRGDPPSSARPGRGRRRRGPATACSTSRPAAATPPSRPPLTGADVVASDLTPELLDGRPGTLADDAASSSTGEEADAEALPYDDGAFDVVHVLPGRDVRAAPPGGGRRAGAGVPPGRHGSGCSAGRREGFIGQMFATMKPYAPPPPPGRAAAAAVGRRGARARAARRPGHRRTWRDKRSVAVDRFATAEEFRDYFKAELRPDDRGLPGNSPTTRSRSRRSTRRSPSSAAARPRRRRPMEWEYLLFTARRR